MVVVDGRDRRVESRRQSVEFNLIVCLSSFCQFFTGSFWHAAAPLSQGPWSETQKNLLGTALADAVSAVPSTKKARRPMQELMAFRSYLTGDDLRVMGSDVGAMVKVGLAVERCAALGLHLPNTGTLKHIIASLCDCHLAFL